MWSNTRRDSGAYRWGAWRRLPKGLRRHDRRFRPGWARCRQQTMAPDAGRKAAFTRHAGIGADDSILADAGALNLHQPSLPSKLHHNPLHRRLLHCLARIQQGEVLAIEPALGQITIMRAVRVARLTRRIDGDRAIPMGTVDPHEK